MKFEIGKQYVNKTWRFLLPCLKDYGNVVTTKLSNLYKVGAFVYDDNMTGVSKLKGENIFLVIDVQVKKYITQKLLNWFRNQDFYVHDYFFGDTLQDRYLILVLKIPDEYKKSYYHFLDGNYSKMYTKEERIKLFSNVLREKSDTPSRGRRLQDYYVLSRNRNQRILENYQRKVKDMFNVNVPDNALDVGELELPLINTEEILNNTQTNIFFNREINMHWDEKNFKNNE